MDGLDELVGRQVLEEQTDRYRFHHEVIRAAVYQDLSFGRRRLLHRRAGEALEKRQLGPAERYADEAQAAGLVVRLAHHFAEAGEGEKAVTYLLRAGDQARELYAHQEAIGHYQRALGFLKEQGDYEQYP